MFKIIEYEGRIDKKFKSLLVHLYCKLTGEEETKLIRFWGRIIEFSLVVVLVKFAVFDIGYSSAIDFILSTVYLLVGFSIGSLVIYTIDYYVDNSSHRVLYTGILLSLVAVISLLGVGYVAYLMVEAFNSAEISINSEEALPDSNSNKKQLFVKEVIQEQDIPVDVGLLATETVTEPDISNELFATGASISQQFQIGNSLELAEKFASLVSIEPIQNSGDFLRQYDELTLNSPEVSELLLMRAITGNLEIGYLLQILNRGAELSGNHLALLLIDRLLEEIKLLENYGLDILQNTSSGRDVVAEVLFNPDREALFDYLISTREVDSTLSSQTLLDVITSSEKLQLDDSYVKKLVWKGASLNEEDKKLVTELSKNNPDFYNGLIETLQI